MKKIIQYSINRPISIIMYLCIFLLFSVIAISTITVDYLPTIKDRELLVSINYPGIPALQMKELITIPAEDNFCSLKGLKNISSTTRDSKTFIKINLQFGTNINTALIEANQIADKLFLTLPKGCSKPQVEILQNANNKLVLLNITPKDELKNSTHLIKNDIIHSLQAIQGVSKIQLKGGLDEQINIILNNQLLLSKKLSPEIIASQILSSNYEYPAGTIKDSKNEYTLKTSSLYKNINDIKNQLITIDSKPIKLCELGNIFYNTKEQDSFCFHNDTENILLLVYKKTGANPIKVIADLKKQIQTLEQDFQNLSIKIVQDYSAEMKSSIIELSISAILGTIICYIIIYLFFKNHLISFFISLSIPFCILFSILALKVFAKTINVFSLSGISIAIGMTVDASIIVIESILTGTKKLSDSKIFAQTKLVTRSIINSVLTTILVFIPFFLLPGLFGELFTDLSIAIISSIIFSGVYALLILPSFIKLFFKVNLTQSKIHFTNLQQIYKTYLVNLKNHKQKYFIYTAILFILTLLSTIFINKEIFPENKSNNLTITLHYPESFSIQNLKTKTIDTINTLQNQTAIKKIITYCGTNPDDNHSYSDIHFKETDVNFLFTNISSKQKKEVISFFQKQNVNYTIIKDTNFIFDIFNINTKPYIQTNDTKKMSELLNKIENYFPNSKTCNQIFIPNEKKIAHYGISKQTISAMTSQFLEGIDCGNLSIEQKQIPIHIYTDSDKTNFHNIQILNNNNIFTLSNFGTFQIQTVPKILFRANKIDSFEIDTQKETAKQIPKEFIYKQDKENYSELIKTSITLFVIVIILLYCILGIQFSSFTIPVFLLLSIIPGLSGGIIFIFIFGQSLNIYSLLSLIVISGIGINNSIILYENISEQKNIVNNFLPKFKPVFITSLTSFCSLIPFAFNIFSNANQTSLAICLSGGILFSFFSSLIFTPLFFSIQKQMHANLNSTKKQTQGNLQ